MPDDPYAQAVDMLGQTGSQRVWSILATVFGDLAQRPGEGIDGPVLTTLMAEIGIKPEATRVALHRLRNDDWIASTKLGRTSRHSLTDLGLRETLTASKVIYGTPQQMAQGWQLVLLESGTAYPKDAMERLGFASLGPRIYVGPDHATPPDGTLAMSPETAPKWLGAQFEPPDLVAEYADLHRRLGHVADLPIDASGLSAIQIGVLRCLIVHGWRRLVLRHPDLPRVVHSDAWRGHACRELVVGLLARLPRPAMDALHSA